MTFRSFGDLLKDSIMTVSINLALAKYVHDKNSLIDNTSLQRSILVINSLGSYKS